MDHCLRSRHYVNVIIAGKHPAPQWLTMDAAIKHCTEGIGIWQWASNDQGVAPDVVMACCGDVPTLETLAAVSIMREHLPELRIRVVNIVDLMKLQPQTEHPHGLSDIDFDELFTRDKPVLFAFHAYPWLIHRLTYRTGAYESGRQRPRCHARRGQPKALPLRCSCQPRKWRTKRTAGYTHSDSPLDTRGRSGDVPRAFLPYRPSRQYSDKG